jgi:hypothetical protein
MLIELSEIDIVGRSYHDRLRMAAARHFKEFPGEIRRAGVSPATWEHLVDYAVLAPGYQVVRSDLTLSLFGNSARIECEPYLADHQFDFT